MSKTRIILFLIAIGATVIIYQLPTVVVEDKKEKVALSEPLENEEEHAETERQLPDDFQKSITSLKESMLNSESKEKRVIFADSLAKVYQNAFFFDSAAYYLEQAANEEKSVDRYKIAGDAYFDAFNFAVSESKRNTLSQKARALYEKVLERRPDDLDAKANMAVTYVTTSAPMQGIMILREILEEEPNHERALFNLGLLSITSGQFDKAVERFMTLIEHHPANHEARLYLGYSYMEIGNPEKAEEEWNKILSSEADGSLKEMARNYLESIN